MLFTALATFLCSRCREMWGRVSSIDPLIYLCINTLPHPHLQHEWGYAPCSHHHSRWDCKPHRLWVEQSWLSPPSDSNILLHRIWTCRSRGWFLALGFICGLSRYSAMFGFVFFFLWLFLRPSPPVSVLNQLPLPSPLPATTTKSLLYNGRIAEEVTCLLGCRDENLASQLAHGLNQVSTEHMWVSPTFFINNIEVKQDSCRLKIMFRSRGTLCVVQNTFT